MIKHLSPREFPEHLHPLIAIYAEKMKCIRNQQWDEAGLWRTIEVNYVREKYNIDIRITNDYIDYIMHFPDTSTLTNS